MKKFFVFFIITIMITSCVSNKKILSPEQLTQDKIQAEGLLGKWKFFPAKGGDGSEIDFYQNNTALWQILWWNYALQSKDLIKVDFNWKLVDGKITLLSTKINSSYVRSMLGAHTVFNIVEYSDNKIILKDHRGKEIILIRL